MVALDELGDRVCIIGPSNSGKSTLAEAIGRKKQLPVIYLDRLYHLPGTDWKPRPFLEFRDLHDEAIRATRWVIDGNYSRLMPQRLARATGFILLDVSTGLSLFRYMRRSLLLKHRIGALEGGKDSLKWAMLRHIAIITPRNRARYSTLERSIQLPKVKLMSARQIKAAYSAWGLERPLSQPTTPDRSHPRQ